MKRFLVAIPVCMLVVCCNRKWTEKDKSEFMSGCLSSAMSDKNIGDSLAKPYCRCILDKIVQKYPNANDAGYIKYDSAIITISKKCLENARATIK